MSGAQSISTRRAYGVQRVCRVWHRARSSVYARRQATRSPALCRRRGPIGAAPERPGGPHSPGAHSPFHGEGYLGEVATPRAGAAVDARARPPSPAARGPRAWAEGARRDHHHRGARRDVGHSTARDRRAFVFVVDHCATACIGLHQAHAADPPGHPRSGAEVARGLRLPRPRVEHLADDFQQEVAFFGIESSPSVPADVTVPSKVASRGPYPPAATPRTLGQ